MELSLLKFRVDLAVYIHVELSANAQGKERGQKKGGEK
jgi:hypothetical protein